MSKQKPFSLDPDLRRRRKLHLQDLLEVIAQNYNPEDMAQLFKGLRRSGRDTLSDLSMSRLGRKLIIDYLREVYEQKQKLIREWARECAKRNAAPRMHKY